MADCLFCRIARGEIPADVVYEDDHVIAFKDIHPVAPVHVLIVPKMHFATILELAASPAGAAQADHLFKAAARVAELTDVDQSGFRLINNCGREGGQSIFHVHFHLLGKKDLGEKLL